MDAPQPLQPPLSFDGVLWVAGQNPASSGGSSSSGSSSASSYPYAFVDVAGPGITGPLLGPGTGKGTCPSDVARVSLEANVGNLNQTLLAMQYLNLLTNTLDDPTLQSYRIQVT